MEHCKSFSLHGPEGGVRVLCADRQRLEAELAEANIRRACAEHKYRELRDTNYSLSRHLADTSCERDSCYQDNHRLERERDEARNDLSQARHQLDSVSSLCCTRLTEIDQLKQELISVRAELAAAYRGSDGLASLGRSMESNEAREKFKEADYERLAALEGLKKSQKELEAALATIVGLERKNTRMMNWLKSLPSDIRESIQKNPAPTTPCTYP